MQYRTRLGLILATAFLAALPCAAETITGTFTYLDADGATRAIAYNKVEIWAFRPRALGIWTWANEATIQTDGAGHISQEMSFGNGVVYGVRVFATNAACIVYPNDVVHTLPFHREPGEPGPVINRTVNDPSDVLDFTYCFADDFAPQHFNIAEALRYARDYADARRDPNESDPIPQVAVQPSSALPTGTFYDPAIDTITLATSDVFEDKTIIHEYAHFLEEQIGSFPWIPSVHDGCEAKDTLGNVINSPEQAWMEAFAEVFAQSVSRTLPPGTLYEPWATGSFSVADLETPPACSASAPDAIEYDVAASLWDLVDATGDPGAVYEPWDFIGNQATAIFQIMDHELDFGPKIPTIWDFRNAWIARGLDQPALDRILAHYGILSLPDRTAQFISQSAPPNGNAGDVKPFSVTMRNTGITTWTAASRYGLGSQYPEDNAVWGLTRVPVPYSVYPGEQVTFSFNVTLPEDVGTHAMQWRMVQDGVQWFGDPTPIIGVAVAPHPLPANVIVVSPSGEDSYDGRTWATAKRSVTQAISSASPGTDIWVAGGTYHEAFWLRSGVRLYGGFSGTEWLAEQRNISAWLTTLDGQALQMSVITAPAGVTGAVVDGFTIRNGSGSFAQDGINGTFYGGGIYCRDSTVTIANCVITGNTTLRPLSTAFAFGGGIASVNASVTVSNCCISNNQAKSGAGIGGSGGDLIVTNCTIAGNTATSVGGVRFSAGYLTLVNSIVAYNTSGVWEAADVRGTVLHHNDVFGNTVYDYSGLADPTGTLGNISQPPLFASRTTADYRLREGSPCIGAGDNTAVLSSWTDLDGRARIVGAAVDIGAYEFWKTVAPFTMQDVTRAVLIASGAVIASQGELGRLDIADSGTPVNTVDSLDVARLLRKVTGAEPNP